MQQEITIEYRGRTLAGHFMAIDQQPKAWVIFAHGSGSSRKSSRNNWVASELNKRGYGTLLFDLLTPEEDEVYENRFNIELLADRLGAATDWLLNEPFYNNTPIAYFGASTGAAAALMAAAHTSSSVPLFAVISRGGRPDLAGEENFNKVHVPCFLLVGDLDEGVIELNEMAFDELPKAEMQLVPGATHLFSEPGTLDTVVRMAGEWLDKQLQERNMGNHLSAGL